MDAKDTVITQRDSDLVRCPSCGAEYAVLYVRMREEQAEISFKAGYKEASKRDWKHSVQAGHQAGIREVVEWIEKNSFHRNSREYEEAAVVGQIAIYNNSRWETKLKEWGIE